VYGTAPKLHHALIGLRYSIKLGMRLPQPTRNTAFGQKLDQSMPEDGDQLNVIAASA
jgi:hypothetical protein